VKGARAHAEGRPPVAIGGVGGSGTRLVAELVAALGYHLGDDLNQASDNLWFTLLFKRLEILRADEAEFDQLVHVLVAALRGGSSIHKMAEARVRKLAEDDRAQHPANWLQARAESVIAAAHRPAHLRPWGWKEPNTHVVIERLWERLPDLRYIHVVRNGVDMAYSSNQNQVLLWGAEVLGNEGPPTPQRSLSYWCAVHRRMQRLRAEHPTRMYWLDYDELCERPGAALPGLCTFLGHAAGSLDDAAGVIKPSNRRQGVLPRDHGLLDADLAYAATLGYKVQAAAFSR
jgi:hypothetical protein